MAEIIVDRRNGTGSVDYKKTTYALLFLLLSAFTWWIIGFYNDTKRVDAEQNSNIVDIKALLQKQDFTNDKLSSLIQQNADALVKLKK